MDNFNKRIKVKRFNNKVKFNNRNSFKELDKIFELELKLNMLKRFGASNDNLT